MSTTDKSSGVINMAVYLHSFGTGSQQCSQETLAGSGVHDGSTSGQYASSCPPGAMLISLTHIFLLFWHL
jgi:hypothetical protein